MAKKLGIKQQTIADRIYEKWPEDRWGESIKEPNHEVTYMGKTYVSLEKLAQFLRINRKTLEERIKRGLPEDQWGEVFKAKISTGYTFEEAPKNLKNAAEKLAIGLNIPVLEAYQLLLEKVDFGKI